MTGRLIEGSQALVDAISFDMNGAMIAGRWQGGNGGMISRETLIKADALRRAIHDARQAAMLAQAAPAIEQPEEQP